MSIKKFVLIGVASCLVILIPVFLFNLYFDPLWYLKGNQHENINYPFNERLSKTNQILRQYKKRKLNCVIFGSSRATLFNEVSLSDKYRCFNYSFSGGTIIEFTGFAVWLKKMGIKPEYIIVAIDDFNFIKHKMEVRIPDYIKNYSRPPNIIRTYLSLDAIVMSFRLLAHKKSMPRLYDENFQGIVQSPPEYIPEIKKPQQQVLNLNAVSEYKKLRNIFPDARYIGFVSPLSPWRLASKTRKEYNYILNSIYDISGFFDTFYDFSVPGKVTGNASNSYDTSHYLPVVYNKLARLINGERSDFGVSIKEMTRKAYIDYHLSALNRFFVNML